MYRLSKGVGDDGASDPPRRRNPNTSRNSAVSEKELALAPAGSPPSGAKNGEPSANDINDKALAYAPAVASDSSRARRDKTLAMAPEVYAPDMTSSNNNNNEQLSNNNEPSAEISSSPVMTEGGRGDVENQTEEIVQAVRDRILQSAPSAQVTGTYDDEAEKPFNDEASCIKRHKLLLIVLVLFALIGGIVGAVVGVTLSGNKEAISPGATSSTGVASTDAPSVAPTVPACTLCADGSEPELDNEIRPGVPCSTLQDELRAFDVTQDACHVGQAQGKFYCSCPTFPEARPAVPVCTYGCPEIAWPPNYDSPLCTGFVTFVELVGQETSQCFDLLRLIPEECRCRDEIVLLTNALKEISDEALLSDKSSPQFAAMEWLAYNDPANLTVENEPVAVLQERYFGALLWFALGGEYWNNGYSFLTAMNVCNWNIQQSSGEYPDGISCSSNGLINIVNLVSNNLTGALPVEIAEMRDIQRISLASNNITGSLPDSIGQLTALEEVVMSMNTGLGGSLPSSLFTETALTQLLLDGSNISGSLPTNIGDAVGLNWLNLDSTNISGTIPDSISKLSLMRTLIFTNCNLTGTLPNLASMQGLNLFSVAQNEMVGTIPEHYGQLSRLDTLGLLGNALTGTIPDLSKMVELEGLFLGTNRLSGDIGRALTSTPTTNLQYFSVEENELTGTIPTAVGRFSSLDGIWLSENQITGTLPTEIGLLTSVTFTFNVGGLSLNGTIPSEIGALTGLRNLAMGDCGLSGSIPSEVGALTSLTNLNLAQNQLNGTIPESFGDLLIAVNVSVASNMLSGTVPSGVAAIQSLESLFLEGNNLSGDLNPFFCTRSNLLDRFRADCTMPAEILCDCCSSCCSDEDGCVAKHMTNNASI